MDIITENLLADFSAEHGIEDLPEERRFEQLAAFITVRRNVDETFTPGDIAVGGDGDAGLDAIATIVNGTLVTDVDEFLDLDDSCGHLDVRFIFVQAKRTPGFDAATIASLVYSIKDFFKPHPSLTQNDQVKEAAAIAQEIFKRSAKFRRGKPECRIYYVTTGTWTAEPALEARRQEAIAELLNENVFRSVELQPIGAAAIHSLYIETKNAISRDFAFGRKTAVPDIAGVEQAWIGLVPAKEFLRLVRDEKGEILKSLFYDNVRDWQTYEAPVNVEIAATLESDHKARFGLMNNGVTIIAKGMQVVGNEKVRIEDYQIVNGCQTTHVLVDHAETLDDTVMVPLRLIATTDEQVTSAIIKATNRQTNVNDEQFFASTEFPKRLETYFEAHEPAQRLYYERRTHQYDAKSIEKARIVTQSQLLKVFAAMFLGEPHATTRSYRTLKAKIGTDIFGPTHRFEPYHVAALAAYRLEYLFRNKKIGAFMKPARFHILLAARLLANPAPVPKMNSHEMAKYCGTISAILADQLAGEDLLTRASTAVGTVAGGKFERDTIRTLPFTAAVIALCREWKL